MARRTPAPSSSTSLIIYSNSSTLQRAAGDRGLSPDLGDHPVNVDARHRSDQSSWNWTITGWSALLALRRDRSRWPANHASRSSCSVGGRRAARDVRAHEGCMSPLGRAPSRAARRDQALLDRIPTDRGESLSIWRRALRQSRRSAVARFAQSPALRSTTSERGRGFQGLARPRRPNLLLRGGEPSSSPQRRRHRPADEVDAVVTTRCEDQERAPRPDLRQER